jgi:hypothetical protein
MEPIHFAARIVAAAAALAVPAAAMAETWRLVAVDEKTSRGVAAAYADLDSISRSGDELRFRMQVRFGSAPPHFDGVRSSMRIQCEARRWGSEDNHLYLGEQRGADIGPTATSDVRPGTNGAIIVDNLCSGRFLSGPVDPAVHSRTLFEAR